MLKQKIEDFCYAHGLDTMGFIPCRRFEELAEFYRMRQEKNLQSEFEETDIEKRINPNQYMEDGKTIISIAFPYYEKGEASVGNGFSIYTKRFDYHRVLKTYLEKICDYIRSLGGRAESFVDSNALPERYIAYLAGVGFIGKNNLIITEKYGSYVFLGEIITDLQIDCKDKRNVQEIGNYAECKECGRCIRECPTRAVSNNNPNICLSYITQKKHISDKEISLLKGNVFGCDFCQLKCPFNEKAEYIFLDEFKTLEYMEEDVGSFANMNNSFFKEKVSSTSCGWRGKNVIKRNAMIHMFQEGYDIREFKGESDYLNEYIDRLSGMKSSLEEKE